MRENCESEKRVEETVAGGCGEVRGCIQVLWRMWFSGEGYALRDVRLGCGLRVRSCTGVKEWICEVVRVGGGSCENIGSCFAWEKLHWSVDVAWWMINSVGNGVCVCMCVGVRCLRCLISCDGVGWRGQAVCTSPGSTTLLMIPSLSPCPHDGSRYHMTPTATRLSGDTTLPCA